MLDILSCLYLILGLRLLTEADAGHTEFVDEVYQNETRFPGGEWKAASEPYTDVVRTKYLYSNYDDITRTLNTTQTQHAVCWFKLVIFSLHYSSISHLFIIYQFLFMKYNINEVLGQLTVFCCTEWGEKSHPWGV